MSKLHALLPLVLLASTHDVHARDLSPVAATRGVETATIDGPIPWCEGIKPAEAWDEEQIAKAAATDDQLFAAALHLCQRPNDTTWKRSARNLLQRWINTSKQSQTDAVASIRVRLDEKKVSTELAALCSSMEEASGLVREFAGCGVKENAPVEIYFDRRGYRNEMQRLYWIYKNLDGLTSYVLLERDFPISRAKLERALDDSVFAENAFARARMNEVLATVMWRKRELEARAATDADAARMRETVDRATVEWDSITAAHRDDLALLANLETRVIHGKPFAGCSRQLDDIFERRLATYGSSDADELKRRIVNDPLAAMILSQLAICHDADKIPDAPLIAALVADVAPIAGPRSFAARALAQMLANKNLREKVHQPISSTDFFVYAPEAYNAYKPELAKGPRGVVRTCEPTAEGLRVSLTDGSVVDVPHRYTTSIATGVYVRFGRGGVALFVTASAADHTVRAFLGYAL
jgi:hypothetical protein